MDARDKLLFSLNERAKELKCLYEVETILNQADKDLVQVFEEVEGAGLGCLGAFGRAGGVFAVMADDEVRKFVGQGFREVWKRREIVSSVGRRSGELTTGELHPVAGIASEANDNGV